MMGVATGSRRSVTAPAELARARTCYDISPAVSASALSLDLVP
jgi:hypothetical protein